MTREVAPCKTSTYVIALPDHRGPHNGEARLRQFRQISTDLVITDLFMRGRDGLDVTKVLRCDSPTVKIIVLTGGSGEWDYLDAAKLLGAHRIIRKPVTVAELLQVVQQELLTSRAV